MNPLFMVIIGAVLVAVIAIVIVLIVKNVASPSKLTSIPKLIKDGKYQQAQRIAKSILAKSPRNYVAHYWLGKTYLADNKPELAFMEYKTVDQNMLFNGEINETSFRKDMADLYSRYNQFDDALKQYLLLTKLEPQNADNDYNVGKIYESKGQPALAMGFYQKAITANKRHAQAHTAMGYLLFRSKQYKDAKKVIDTAIRLNPENYQNYYYLGKILKESQDLPAAVKSFEKAERDPEFRQKALIERGSCLMQAGQTEQAVSDFERAISAGKDERSQDSLYARYFLAASYEKTRKIEKAIEQWEIIYKINSKFRDVGTKLNQYKDLQTNDGMKEYLTAGNTNFMEICKKIALAGFKLQCQKLEPTKFGCTMLATEDKSENWMNMRQQVYLVLFYRVTDALEDSIVRKVVETVKAQGYVQGIIITSSDFTPSAQAYAENRSVQLIAKDQLEAIFKKTGI